MRVLAGQLGEPFFNCLHVLHWKGSSVGNGDLFRLRRLLVDPLLWLVGYVGRRNTCSPVVFTVMVAVAVAVEVSVVVAVAASVVSTADVSVVVPVAAPVASAAVAASIFSIFAVLAFPALAISALAFAAALIVTVFRPSVVFLALSLAGGSAIVLFLVVPEGLPSPNVFGALAPGKGGEIRSRDANLKLC